MLRYYLREKLRPDIYGHGFKGLMKQAFAEVPYFMLAIVPLAAGLGMVPFVCYKYSELEGDKRRYMYRFTIFRPDDPRIQKYKFIECTDGLTSRWKAETGQE